MFTNIEQQGQYQVRNDIILLHLLTFRLNIFV